jgi:hypothetical protein
MKTSVYLPDELWTKVLEANPEASASALLQEFLRARYEKPAEPAYASLTPELEAQRAATTDQMRKLVTKGYQDGYAMGLVAVTDLNYQLLSILNAHDFVITEFEKELTDYPVPMGEGMVFDFDSWWDDYLEEAGLSEDWNPTDMPAFVMRGVTDALRFVWDGMNAEAYGPGWAQPTPVAAAPADPGEAPDA